MNSIILAVKTGFSNNILVLFTVFILPLILGSGVFFFLARRAHWLVPMGVWAGAAIFWASTSRLKDSMMGQVIDWSTDAGYAAIVVVPLFLVGGLIGGLAGLLPKRKPSSTAKGKTDNDA